MDIISSLNEQQIIQLHALYQQEWWASGRTLNETRRCVAGSQICVGLVNAHHELVGFSRVLTDYTFKALIFDVIVRKDMRGTQLGDTLLTQIIQHPQLTSVKHFELYCLPELYDFYSRHNFSTEVGDIRLMRLNTKPN